MIGLAISNIAWPEAEDEAALALAASSGFTALELAPAKAFGAWATMDPAGVRGVAACLAARGLPVVALQGIVFGIAGAKLFGSREEQAALARHLRFVARIGGACGGVPCVFGAPGLRDPGQRSPTDARTMAAAFFAAVAPAFAAEGASLALEAIPVDYGCRFVTSTAAAIELVREVATPGFGLQIDTGTMLTNAEDPALLARAAPLAVHCHASVPGLGPVAPHAAALAPLAAALRAAGWRRIVSVEMRASPDWRTAVREAGAAMLPIWG
jgi:sugar phosphate isomerase/epimerase